MSESHDLFRLLRAAPVLAELSDQELAEIASTGRVVQHPPGHELDSNGAFAGLHIVLAGSATVLQGDQPRGRATVGDHFGDMTVATNQDSSRSVRAESPLRLFVLPASSLDRLIETNPHLVIKLLAGDQACLRRDVLDGKEQLAATNRVLTTLGGSAMDPDAVLGTIVDSASRLCRAQVGQLYLLEEGVYRLASSVGLSERYQEYIARHPLTPDRRSVLGRAGLERRVLQIPDVLADSTYGRQDLQEIGGFRTSMAAPMLVDNDVVGVLLLWRTEVDPFDDRAMTLVTVFAAQAAIAVRNVQLVRALEDRTTELAGKVEQLEALHSVGEAVSSSLDLDQVLSTIVMNAVHLSDTDGGSLLEYAEAEGRFIIRTAYGTKDALLDRLRNTPSRLESTLVGRCARERSPLVVEDIAEVERDPHLEGLFDAGWRSVVAVPMLRNEQIIGALVVRRLTPGDFSEETLDLLQTFATQSALAIVNARLFREVELKSGELAVAGQHKSEFLASMSHELRTPLNAVIGFSEVLLERMFGDINERQEEYLRDIWSSGKHLLELLNEILDLSKIEAGRMEIQRSTFVVRDSLEYGVSLVRERAASHAIELSLEVGPDVDTIDCDELRFKQVVLNLLSNAVKFTPDGGRVGVRAERRADDLVVTVTDTGVGIPLEDEERIFESFQQGGRGTTKEEGTGLGLTLSRRIARLLGGEMSMTSKVGVGSAFSFTVPVGEPESSEPAAAVSARHPGRPLVVVIEDDRQSRDLVTVYLEAAELDVVSAHDGGTGLALVRELKPAAVVLDIALPGLNGWQVIEAIKADEETALTPVIVVSVIDDRSRGLALGAAEYLVKPISREAVLAALAKVGVRSATAAGSLTSTPEPG